MDKGLIGLMVLSGLVALLSLFKYVNIVPASVVWSMIQLSLVYHTIYTIYTIAYISRADFQEEFSIKKRNLSE
jgi:hypothetical protein